MKFHFSLYFIHHLVPPMLIDMMYNPYQMANRFRNLTLCTFYHVQPPDIAFNVYKSNLHLYKYCLLLFILSNSNTSVLEITIYHSVKYTYNLISQMHKVRYSVVHVQLIIQFHHNSEYLNFRQYLICFSIP